MVICNRPLVQPSFCFIYRHYGPVWKRQTKSISSAPISSEVTQATQLRLTWKKYRVFFFCLSCVSGQMRTGARLWCVLFTHADRAHTHAGARLTEPAFEKLIVLGGWDKKRHFITLPFNPLARRAVQVDVQQQCGHLARLLSSWSSGGSTSVTATSVWNLNISTSQTRCFGNTSWTCATAQTVNSFHRLQKVSNRSKFFYSIKIIITFRYINIVLHCCPMCTFVWSCAVKLTWIGSCGDCMCGVTVQTPHCSHTVFSPSDKQSKLKVQCLMSDSIDTTRCKTQQFFSVN